MRVRSVRRIVAVLLSLAGAAGCGSGTSGATKTSAEVILNERMASVLLHEGRFQDAETAYRDVIRSDPKNPEVHDGLESSNVDRCDGGRGCAYGTEKSFHRAPH